MTEAQDAQKPRVNLKEHLEAIKADRAAGKSTDAIAKAYGVNKGSIHYLLYGKKKPLTATLPNVNGNGALQGNEKLQGSESVGASPSASQSELESDRKEARKLMRKALQGKAEPSAQQTALIRLLLKDELEPEAESNPYAGQPLEELCLRALTLCVSVLGLVRVSALLSSEAKAGTLDLGLNWTPDDEPTLRDGHVSWNGETSAKEQPQSLISDVMQQQGSPTDTDVETLESPPASKPHTQAAGDARILDSKIESLE